ncbi:CYTH domain-containing protein [Fodinibacter luteus]|uniref:CYTH domain-containing protein n=1 Tax=Fodinibacter luteus TaxID=552064 RepID=A0ABP8KEJ9_9MICO
MDLDPADTLDDHEWERKFLVGDSTILRGLEGYHIEQGYLWSSGGFSLRIRRTLPLGSALAPHEVPYRLTLKGPRVGNGLGRLEIESQVPNEYGHVLLAEAQLTLRKRRYPYISEGETWDIDVFEDGLEGLIIAEIEGSRERVALARMPWWASLEVTSDERYSNESLAAHGRPE